MGECPKHQLPSHQLLGFTLEKQTNATINDQLGTQYYPVPLPYPPKQHQTNKSLANSYVYQKQPFVFWRN